MEYLPRSLNIAQLLQKKSFFLFGPRATGKSTLIEHQLPQVKVFDLLDARLLHRFTKDPGLLAESIEKTDQFVVIDEIQKLPILLDEVHRLIKQTKIHFLLTGSSARKLKRGAANLLAGRAWQSELFPLTSQEIPRFNLLNYLNKGGLPQVYFSKDPHEELESYVSLYLKEEVQAESLTRNYPSFIAFLDSIALSNAEEINLESFARDCGVSPVTVKNYLGILEDTLIGFSIPGFTKTKKRKATARIKHYLFDVGVVNQLCHRGEIAPKSELFGKCFEQFIFQEMRAYLSYHRLRLPMYYWRSVSFFEVDLILSHKIAIEIKSTHQVNDSHLKGLRALKEEGLIEKYCVVSLDDELRHTKDGITIYPWKLFLEKLWAGLLF